MHCVLRRVNIGSRATCGTTYRAFDPVFLNPQWTEVDRDTVFSSGPLHGVRHSVYCHGLLGDLVFTDLIICATLLELDAGRSCREHALACGASSQIVPSAAKAQLDCVSSFIDHRLCAPDPCSRRVARQTAVLLATSSSSSSNKLPCPRFCVGACLVEHRGAPKGSRH